MKRSTHAVAWVLLVVAAVALWPQRWGGTMTYVITSGTSMQPAFLAGDLAVLRTADAYGIGDVVAYKSEQLDRIVMHRVLTKADGIYTLQGDNNDFVDPDQVRDEQMLGRLALRVPQVGPALTWLFKPVNVLLVVGALFLLFSDRKKDTDRRQAAVVPLEPLILRVSEFCVPPTAAVADLVDDADLMRIAARYDRPVLQDEAGGRSWVHDGATVYRHQAAIEVTPEVGSGRDWQYGLDPDVVKRMPRPRRQAQDVPEGVRLGKLLKLG